MTGSKTQTAPTHLTKPTRTWWEAIYGAFELEPHHEMLLTAAGEAWDTAQRARKTILKDGPYFKNRFNEPKAHPAIAVERDAKLTFARLLRELRLDIQAPEESRPPVSFANMLRKKGA